MPLDRRHTAAPAWVIGRASDLAWLIGGALVSYALLAAHVVAGVPAVTLYALWVLTIDGPHVFATLSRTYLDAEERGARARLLRWSLSFFAIGPASIVLSVLTGTRVPFDVFLAFCSLWAYWHVVRQHYGVMVLYKKKAGDCARPDDLIDALFIHVGLLAPFVGYIATSERTAAMLGLEASLALAGDIAVAAWSVFAGALVAPVARQVSRIRAGTPSTRRSSSSSRPPSRSRR